MRHFIGWAALLIAVGAPGCGSEDAGGGGSAIVGEPCSGGSDCASGLACLKDGDGDFVCTEVAGETDGTGTGGETATGGGTGDTGGTTGGEDGVCPIRKPAGAPCNAFCQTGCADGEHCTFQNNLFVCEAPGPGDVGDPCAASAECGVAQACLTLSGGTQQCHQFCADDAGCPAGRKCSVEITLPSNEKGRICGEPTSGCDVFDPASCGAGQACIVTVTGAAKCMTPGALAEGEACKNAGDNSCVAGLQCLVTCRPVCGLSGGDVPCSACTGEVQTISEELGIGACTPDVPPAECGLVEQDCGAGQGCYQTQRGWECLNAGNVAAGGTCTFNDHCLPGALCADVADADPAAACGQKCADFNPITPDPWMMGVCAAP